MEISIQKLPKSQIEVLVEISVENFQNFIEKTIKKLGQEIEIPGFRKGFAPKEIIERQIGQAKILEQAAEMTINENYPNIINQLKKENKIEVVGQPEIQVLKLGMGNSLIYKMKFSILPEIKLGDYKKIASQIKQNQVFVEEAEIKEKLIQLQKLRAKFSQVDRPAQKHDWVEINYSSLSIEDGKNIEDKFILGEGKLIKGFEKNIEGMRQGEKKEFSLDVPSDYHYKQIAGKKIYFQLKLISVQKVELPKLDDEFAKSIGYENLTILKQEIRKGIEKEKREMEKKRRRQEILNKIIQESFFEVPDILIESNKKQMIENLKKYVSEKLHLQFEEYLKRLNITEKQMETSFLQQSQQQLKEFFILKEIAKKENINVSEQEIKKEIDRTLKENPDIKDLDIEKTKMYIKEVIINEKVFNLLE